MYLQMATHFTCPIYKLGVLSPCRKCCHDSTNGASLHTTTILLIPVLHNVVSSSRLATLCHPVGGGCKWHRWEAHFDNMALTLLFPAIHQMYGHITFDLPPLHEFLIFIHIIRKTDHSLPRVMKFQPIINFASSGCL